MSMISSAQKVSYGFIETIDFKSNFIAPRQIYIYKPTNTEPTSTTKVIFMHDGQHLFDASNTWNKQSWEVDETARQLANDDLNNFIVIGIDNSELRWNEYFPQDADNQNKFNGLHANDYLKFLISELKPFIKKRFLEITDNSDFYMIGSSMGGLISLYGQLKYSNEFNGFAGLSTHWLGVTGENKEYDQAWSMIELYLSQNITSLANKKIYLDRGTETLDKHYELYQKQVDQLISDYGKAYYKSLIFEGHKHEESSWANRLSIPIKFLLDE
ncbi:MAG: alpha/beta hydrolase-fold protein [Proteobacteria bacterium]|nr:alpha/beta hydrolase-fold protein [Pseudomonadota bacterium]